jgi:hypothetical protein
MSRRVSRPWRGACGGAERVVPAQTIRINVDLFLSPAERRDLEAKAAAQLRAPANYVTQLVLAALGRKRPPKVSVPPAKRTCYSVKLRLTAQQRRELEKRAKAEGRSLANFVTAVVVSKLGKT